MLSTASYRLEHFHAFGERCNMRLDALHSALEGRTRIGIERIGDLEWVTLWNRVEGLRRLRERASGGRPCGVGKVRRICGTRGGI